MPRVALLGAVETVSESMPDSLESAILTQMNRRGQIKACLVDGPLSLDTAICPEAATRKGIDSPVAGKADILVASELREANTLSKALHYYARRRTASVIVGTRSPIVMTSRTDDFHNKLNSIAASCLLQQMSVP
jgi:phosphotransacetylase